MPIQAGGAVGQPGAIAPFYRVVPPDWSSPIPNAGSWWDILPPDVRFAGSTLPYRELRLGEKLNRVTRWRMEEIAMKNLLVKFPLM